MKLQCKTASAESYFLINRDQFLFLQEQDMIFVQTDKKSKQKVHQTRVRVLWNAFQANGSKRQSESIPSGYFATSYAVETTRQQDNETTSSLSKSLTHQLTNSLDAREVERAGGYYSAIVGKLNEGHTALKERIRLIYLNPDKTRLIVISKFYDGYKNIKACQEVLNKALGWQSTKGCCNLNRDYPFPLKELVLFEDARFWTEQDGQQSTVNGQQSDAENVANGEDNDSLSRSLVVSAPRYKIEFDKEGGFEYIGTKDNWISFSMVTDILNNRADKKLMDLAYEYDMENIQGSALSVQLTEEEQQMVDEEREKRNRLLSDKDIPKSWPFPLNMIARVAPYNFIRPVLLASCFHVVTMLSAFKGSKNVKFIRRDNRTGKPIEKLVNQSVSNGLFMILEAPPSSGKQSFTYLDSLLWSEHMKEDAETYASENEYNDKVNRKGQNKESPVKPIFKVSCISPKTTFAQLIDRINSNDGRMMKCYSPEIHDLFSSLANGGNAKTISTAFSSFLRMIKDQDLFSVDYKITTAKKGFHVGRINISSVAHPAHDIPHSKTLRTDLFHDFGW